MKKYWWLLLLPVAGFFLMLLAKLPALGLDGPEFCGQCHVMHESVGTYLHSAHRPGATCGDCHVPHDLVYGAAYKAYTGTRDVMAVATNSVPAEIRVTEWGKRVVQDNCLRCHGNLMSVVGNTKRSGGRFCFECHRSTPHQNK